MELIFLLLKLLLALFIGVVSYATPVTTTVTVEPVTEAIPAVPVPSDETIDGSAQDAEPQMRVLAVVESVDVLQLESFPVQIQLQVSGYHQDGCEAPVEVIQRRDGNNVTVELYRVLPAAVMCPMVLQPLEETVSLEGGFEPGTYTIDVNGVIVEVTI